MVAKVAHRMRSFKLWSAITGVALVVAVLLTFLPYQVDINTDGLLSISLQQAEANPGWLSDYSYRKVLNITGQSGAGTNYQVKLLVGESSGATGENFDVESHCTNFPTHADDPDYDITFTDNNGTTELVAWVESVTGTTPNRLATTWVKVADDLSSGTVPINVYYGKSGDASGSNGTGTFNLFDNFGVVTKAAGNPILSPGVDNTYHDYRGMREPRIYKDGSTYYLHYDGCGQATVDPYWTICRAHATSLEGPWTKDGRVLAVGNNKLVGHDDTTATGQNALGYIIWTKYTAVASGALIGFNIKCSGSGNVKVGVYSDNGSGTAPVNRLTYTGSTAIVSGWNSISISSTSITEGTIYWLAFNSDTAVVGYKTETGTRKYIAKAFSFDMPNPATDYGSLSDSTGYQDLVAGWSVVSTTEPWDSKCTSTGTIVKSGSTYYMLYTGTNLTTDDIPYQPFNTGIATSSNITGPWTKYGNNPVFQGTGSPGDWDEWYTLISSVIPAPVSSNYTWMGFYLGADSDNTAKIGIAYSNDLYTWTRYGSNPIISTPVGSSAIENPDAFQVGDTWYLSINHLVNSAYTTNNLLYKATNTDLTAWSLIGQIVSPTSGAWDSVAIGMTSTIVENGVAQVLYDASNEGTHWNRKIGLQYVTDFPAMELSGWTNLGGVTVKMGEVYAEATNTTTRGIESTTAFGTNYALRIRVKPTHVNNTAYLEGVSLQVTATNQYGAYFDHVDASYNGKYYTTNNGIDQSFSSITGETAGSYQILDLIRNASTSVIGKINDANTVTMTTNLVSGNAYPDIIAYANNSQIAADWILVRKYVSPEPAFASAGSEEGINPEITNSQDSWAIGVVATSTVKYFSATGTQDDDYALITNTGNCAVDIQIQGTNIEGGSYDWVLASAAGSEQYSLYANSEASPTVYNIEVKLSSYNNLCVDLADGDTYSWSMKFTTPSAFNANDDGNQKSCTITLVASEAS